MGPDIIRFSLWFDFFLHGGTPMERIVLKNGRLIDEQERLPTSEMCS